MALDGALLINKPEGITSFGVIELLQRRLREKYGTKRSQLPKMGHGGTLDPFATGLLVVCSGKAVKLARYFLGSAKSYEGVIRFGETTVPGDPTSPVTERSDKIPASLEEIRRLADKLTKQPYLQTPPMHSAKKKDGRPLYQLARAGIEVEREPKLCHLHSFEILDYTAPRARFRLECSSGTYVRTLAQDLGRMLGTVALLESLSRLGSGQFRLENALTADEIAAATDEGRPWDELPCWLPFDRLLEGFPHAEASGEEARALSHGQQHALLDILGRLSRAAHSGPNEKRDSEYLAIYHLSNLIAVARREQGVWGLERVFPNLAGE